MKRFEERNQTVIGIVGVGILVLAVVVALNFARLPLISNNTTYQADFANAGGLSTGDIVTVAGVREGAIKTIKLHGTQVRITFQMPAGVHLHSDASVAAKVLTPIGQEFLQIKLGTTGTLHSVIPESRTSIPNSLVGDLNQLTTQTESTNLNQLAASLEVGAKDLQGTPATETAAALTGLARFSQVLGARQNDLSVLVTQGANLTGILAQRSGELVSLVGQGDLVLQVLNERRAAITQLLATTGSLSQQLSRILTGDRTQLSTLLTNLSTVSAVLAKDGTSIGNAIPVLAAFDRYTANATGTGPFADVNLPTLLLPDNLLKQCAGLGPFNAQVGCRP